jgi:4'-phosphopantetheinyl transferase EntD
MSGKPTTRVTPSGLIRQPRRRANLDVIANECCSHSAIRHLGRDANAPALRGDRGQP